MHSALIRIGIRNSGIVLTWPETMIIFTSPEKPIVFIYLNAEFQLPNGKKDQNDGGEKS